MVAFYDDSDDIEQHPKTLTYWVRNFRMKRLQMRRKVRGSASLRVNAILTTALFNAEHELRRKQQERFSRWLDIQTKFIPHSKVHEEDASEKYHQGCDATTTTTTTDTDEFERQKIEKNLWQSELSGLDRFLNSLSSSNKNNNERNDYRNQNKCAITVAS